MRRAKYKVGDIVKIKPGTTIGTIIGEGEIRADDNTTGIITDVKEFNAFAPDYYVDLLLSNSDKNNVSYFVCYDANYVAGYADNFYEEDDICAEEMGVLLG